MRDLEGKVAVVTGGASGIGRAMAAQFAADGMQVVIADVEAAALEATSGELGVVGVQTDVGDAASVQALADHVCDRFGTVHVLCNNAGVGGGGQIADLTLADWKWVLDVNLWGVIHGLHSFLPRILANPDGGHVVNTASMAGLFASAGMGPYNATKFAVVAISETLSKELQAAGSSVGVSVLCPGFVRTNIFDSQRNRPDALRNATKAVGDARSAQRHPQGISRNCNGSGGSGVARARRDRRGSVLDHHASRVLHRGHPASRRHRDGTKSDPQHLRVAIGLT